tara:strand:+ start:21 stop:611 length:591 start_codon:yes stop_codon:yes gene_type:complete
MSRKYFDLAIVKTNKPNSKKTINEFAEEFGYTDYLQEEVALDKRSIGITIVSDDLIFELENFSKNKTDKFTLNFAKVNKKNSEDFHILKKCEFTEGKMTLEEKDDTKRILIEKEEKALKEKQLANSKNKQNNKQRNNRRNNHKNNNSNKPRGQHKGQQKPNENNPKGQNQQDNKQHQKNNTQKPRSRNHLRRKNKP